MLLPVINVSLLILANFLYTISIFIVIVKAKKKKKRKVIPYTHLCN
jgi:hypothetical protein